MLALLEQQPASLLERVNFIGGHIGYAGSSLFGRPIKYITFIREPKERLISDYREQCKPGRFFYEKLKKRSFDFSFYLDLVHENKMDNIFTRQFAGPKDVLWTRELNVDSEMMNAAIINAKDFIIGHTGRFDESIYKISKALNWKKLKYKRLNTSTASQPILLNEEIKKRVDDLTSYDQVLYNEFKDQSLMPIRFFEKVGMLIKMCK